MPTAAHVALLGLLAVLTSACASTPELETRRFATLDADDRVVVVYEHRGDGNALALHTAAVKSLPRLSNGSAPAAKRTTTEEMQALLDSFATLGFFEQSSLAEPRGAKASLTVDYNGQVTRVWGVATGGDAAPARRFYDHLMTFNALFNRVNSFESTTDVDPRALKRRENELRRAQEQSMRNRR